MLTSRVLDQIIRDPSLSVDSVHHDRITGPLTPPDLLGMEERPPIPGLPPPPPDMDASTGEIEAPRAPGSTDDPDADLHLAIRECETMADLNRMMADIAKLKNGRREAAIAVFNAHKEQIGKKG